MASGALIRLLVPHLNDKTREPPVLAVAEDGSSVVPLVGGHHGANDLARRIAGVIGSHAAITTAGDLKFGIALDQPPEGYVLANPEAAKAVMAEKKTKIAYSVGTMIEVPRGALTADEIAQTAEFFSFGTNDLTQTALGMSRDDSGSFLPGYADLEIVKKNPFATIDTTGVGQLMKIAIEKGNKTRPGIKLGICGEHGGDPDSVKFCHKIGLTY
eukprot:gene64760-88591_t